jgi:hypothetical protein
MAFYESSFNPAARFVEPMRELDPVTKMPIVSEGLLQLGYSDNLYHGCHFDWAKDSSLDTADPKKTILDPYTNLQCGIIIMSQQIEKYGSIVINRGAYWAVIKKGHPNIKVEQIKKIVTNLEICKIYE